MSPIVAAPRVVILMPMRDEMTWPTRFALNHNSDWPFELLTEVGLPVDVARNRLASRVRALDPRPDMVVWADDDAFWTRKTFTRLLAALDQLTVLDVVGVVHSKRNFGSCIAASWVLERHDATTLRVGVDFPKEALARCGFIGGHMFAHRPELLDAIGEDPFTLAETDAAEDFAFCRRVAAIGGGIYLHANVPVFHFDKTTGWAYLPNSGPFKIDRAGGQSPVQMTGDGRAHAPILRRYGSAVDEARRRNFAACGVDVDVDKLIAMQEAGEDVFTALRAAQGA